MEIDRKDWYDERNWTPFNVVDGREGLRVSLEGYTNAEIESLEKALKGVGIEYGTKKASVSQYNIQAGDLTLRVLGPENVEKLKSKIFEVGKSNKEFWKDLEERTPSEQQTGGLKSSIQAYVVSQEEDKELTERSADFGRAGGFDSYGEYVQGKGKEQEKKEKREPFISPWDILVSGLKNGNTTEEEVAAFDKAIKDLVNMDFKAPDGSSLSPSKWTDTSGNSIYLLLADRGKTELLNLLKIKFYSSVADFDRQNDDGISPLHAAARGGHVKTCEFLIKEGANAQSKNKNDDLPYAIAKSNHHAALAEYLRIEYGKQHLSNPEKDPKYKAEQDARKAKLYGAYNGY